MPKSSNNRFGFPVRFSPPRLWSALLAALTIFSPAHAQDTAGHPPALICADYNGMCILRLDAGGAIVWRHPTKGRPLDMWALPGGNILYAAGNAATEVSPEHKVVFEYALPGGAVVGCQRLEDGRTFLADSSNGRLLIVDGQGVISAETSIAADLRPTDPPGMRLRGARRLDNGNYLVSHYSGKRVCEYTPDGTRIFEVAIPGGAFNAYRLASGNTLISVADKDSNAKLIEVNPQGNTVWAFANADLAGSPWGKAPLKFITGFHRLADGTTVIANWLGHGHLGQHPQIFAVTPDKRVAWAWADHEGIKAISTLQVLDGSDTAAIH